jgi:hypothetical protein
VLSLAGCAGVPTSGRVHVERRVPAEGPDLPEGPSYRRGRPPDPSANATPEDIVRGFLLAQASSDGDHAIARKYLGPNVLWDPAGAAVSVYTSPRIGKAAVRGDTATVTATVDRVGTVNDLGEFSPPLTPSGPVVFRLRRVTDGWRLASAPPGVLLTNDDLATYYQRVTLYFPTGARRLVPHTVFLRASDQPVAAVTRALLGGPRGWIEPAVGSAIPKGTELLDPPTVVDGVVSVNQSREIRSAPQESIGLLIAQVVWTLTEPALSVDAVRVLVEGDDLAAPGRGSLREHRREDWAAFAPVPAADDERLFFVRDWAPVAVDSAGRASRVASLPPLASFAVSRSGRHIAAVTRPSGGKQSLLVADLTAGGRPRVALTADRITTPTWEPDGAAAWVAVTRGTSVRLHAVPAAPGPVADIASSLPAGAVTSLRLSPDGARVAALIAGVPGPRLWIARVERSTGTRVVAAPRGVAPSVSQVTAVTFDTAGAVVVAGVLGGVRALVRLDVDGFNPTPLRAQGLPASAVVALTSSSSAPPDRVASVGGRLWRRAPGADWAALAGSGTAATYAG